MFKTDKKVKEFAYDIALIPQILSIATLITSSKFNHNFVVMGSIFISLLLYIVAYKRIYKGSPISSTIKKLYISLIIYSGIGIYILPNNHILFNAVARVFVFSLSTFLSLLLVVFIILSIFKFIGINIAKD